MLTLRSVLPALAVVGVLSLSSGAEAAGGGFGQAALTTSRAASGSAMVLTSKSMFGRTQTVTHFEADGSKASVTEKRGLFGGRKVEVTHKDAAGNTTYQSSTKTARSGAIKDHSSSGSGWSTSTTTRRNLLGRKTTEHEAHNADGSSITSTTKTYADGRVMKSDSIEKDGAGNTTTTTARRGFFTNNLKRETVVTDANSKTLATSVEKFRDNETLKKAVVRQNGDKIVTKFDKQERVKKETIKNQFGEKTTTKNSY